MENFLAGFVVILMEMPLLPCTLSQQPGVCFLHEAG